MNPTSLEDTIPNRDLRAFVESLGRATTSQGLFHSALLVSAIQFDRQESEWWRRSHEHLDALVDELRGSVGLAEPGNERRLLQELAHAFSGPLGFQGDSDQYHAADNSCLDRVLVRRRGLPITLSLLLTTLGTRLGLTMHGIGARGHFLAGAYVDGEMLFLDPFTGPDVLTPEEAVVLLCRQTGLAPQTVAPSLRPAAPGEILVRMLNNLKVTYSRSGDLGRLVRVLDWVLAIDPDNTQEMLTRGLILLRLGDTHRGAKDLLHYVAMEPGDLEQIERIKQELLRAQVLRAKLN